MSASFYLVLGLIVCFAFAIWLVRRSSRAQGRAEAEAATNKRMAENAETMGRVMVEKRTKDDAADRLDAGTF